MFKRGFKFEGVAAVFSDPDDSSDIILPGAFKKSLEKLWPVLLFNHDPAFPIGRVVHLEETAFGLEGEFELNLLTRDGKDAHGMILGGSCTGLSIGYKSVVDKSTPDGRQLIEIDLREISLVAMPMHHRARVRT